MNEIQERIVHHARLRFFTDGIHRVSMDLLASELRVSKKTIYQFFPKKEALVEEAVMMFVNENARAVQEIFDADGNPLHKLVALMEFLPSVITQISGAFLNDLKIHLPQLWQRIDEIRTRIIRRNMLRIIEQGKQEKFISDFPDELIVQAFVGAIRNVVSPEFLTSTSLSYAQAVRQSIKMMVYAIVTEKGKKVFDRINMEH